MELDVQSCGMWKIVASEIDKTGLLVAWKWEYGSVDGRNMFDPELLVKASQGQFGRVVVFAKVAKHDVLQFRPIVICHKTSRFRIRKMSERPFDALL